MPPPLSWPMKHSRSWIIRIPMTFPAHLWGQCSSCFSLSNTSLWLKSDRCGCDRGDFFLVGTCVRSRCTWCTCRSGNFVIHLELSYILRRQCRGLYITVTIVNLRRTYVWLDIQLWRIVEWWTHSFYNGEDLFQESTISHSNSIAPVNQNVILSMT